MTSNDLVILCDRHLPGIEWETEYGVEAEAEHDVEADEGDSADCCSVIGEYVSLGGRSVHIQVTHHENYYQITLDRSDYARRMMSDPRQSLDEAVGSLGGFVGAAQAQVDSMRDSVECLTSMLMSRGEP